MSRLVSKLSSVHRGTAFERCSLNLLQEHFSMSLSRVGGKSDGGIDLIGWWWLPFRFSNTTIESDAMNRTDEFMDTEGVPRRRLRVLAQCKAERKKFSPRYVREMEGVWHLQAKSLASESHSPQSTSSSSLSSGIAHANVQAYPTVALLLSESPFSQSTLLHAYRSNVPFLLIHIPSPQESDANLNVNTPAPLTSSPPYPPELGSVCPNPALTHLVHPLSFRWERNPSASAGPSSTTTTEVASWVKGRPGLWWDGRKLGSWVPDDQVLGSECSESSEI